LSLSSVFYSIFDNIWPVIFFRFVVKDNIMRDGVKQTVNYVSKIVPSLVFLQQNEINQQRNNHNLYGMLGRKAKDVRLRLTATDVM